MPKQVFAFLGPVGYYRKFIRNFVEIAKPLTLLTHQQATFEWTPTHHSALLTLKESVIQAPILHYPQSKEMLPYFIQMHPMMPVEHNYLRNMMKQISQYASLSHMFTGTQQKWSTMKQEA